ncbi:MAG: nucleotide exchange factor GrpE [PVC group bacterium]
MKRILPWNSPRPPDCLARTFPGIDIPRQLGYISCCFAMERLQLSPSKNYQGDEMTTGKKHHAVHQPKAAEQAETGEKLPEMVEIPAPELEELRRKAAADSEYKEKMLRAMADMENLRKRMERERKDYIDYANQELIYEILPVLDNFDRALQSAEKTAASAPYLQGVEMIYKQLEEVLKRQGVEEIKAGGERFDPHLHEAVQTEETDRYPEDTVLDVIMKGYLFRGRLLRPAVVKVSRPVVPPGKNKNEQAQLL